MKEQFQSFTQLCTRSLADDPALRLEVEQELEGHLEDACEEERSEGKSETEAENLAKQRFGEPEELAQSLLDANRRKLKLRARIRLAVKVALIPAILIGLALCIDLRTLAGIQLLNTFTPYPRTPGYWTQKYIRILADHETRKLGEPERKWLRNYFCHWDSKANREWARESYLAHPDSKMFTANYAMELTSSLTTTGTKNQRYRRLPLPDTQREELWRVIKHGRRIDPDNALYDYLEADEIAASCITWDEEKRWDKSGRQRTIRTRYEIKDRATFDRGMKLYLAALEKPFVKSYSRDIIAEARSILKPQDDFLGLLEFISINANTKLGFLLAGQELTRLSIAYGEILEKEGNPEAAKRYLESWRRFIPQMEECHPGTLIKTLICYNCLDLYLDSAERRGDMIEAEKLKKVNAAIRTWSEQKKPDNEAFRQHAGMLAGQLLPTLKNDIRQEELEPDLKLTYLVHDLTGLALLSLLLTFCIFLFACGVLAFRFTGRRPFLLILPWKSYRTVLLWGILIPIGIFLLYTHVDALSGRDLSVQANLLRWGLGMLGIVIIFPLIFESLFAWQLKKQGKILGFTGGKIPFATLCLNRMFAFAALLLVTGCILRPLLAWECRREIARVELFNTTRGFAQAEVRLANRLSAEQTNAIAEADQKP